MAAEGSARHGTEGPQRPLAHLDGARCMASLWIVCANYIPRQHGGGWDLCTSRSNVAVCFFVTLSGFMTHWVYDRFAPKDDTAAKFLRNFYWRRMTRPLVLALLAMLVSIAVDAWQQGFPDSGEVARCFFFLGAWGAPGAACPASVSWTAAALLPSWILFPATTRGVAWAESRAGAQGLCGIILVAWLTSVLPAVLFYGVGGHQLSEDVHVWFLKWPLALLLDFIVGVAAAALLRRGALADTPYSCGIPDAESRSRSWPQVPTPGSSPRGRDQPPLMSPRWSRFSSAATSTPRNLALAPGGEDSAHKLHSVQACDITCGYIADLCACLVLSLVLFIPAPGLQAGWEPLFSHGFAPLFAAFFYFSSATGSAGRIARLLRHRSMASLGPLSFAVALLQAPLHRLFTALAPSPAGSQSSETFMAFLFALWVAAGLVTEVVEKPLRCLLDTAGTQMGITIAQSEFMG